MTYFALSVKCFFTYLHLYIMHLNDLSTKNIFNFICAFAFLLHYTKSSIIFKIAIQSKHSMLK